jgi:predicted CopG family antitoxin
MKNINEKFTDEEFKKLVKAKKLSDTKSWHDFIMSLTETKEEKEDV